MYDVILSDHARERLIERAGTARGARADIASRLISVLRLGTTPSGDLGVTVHMRDGYRAVCYPSLQGGWVVATVLPPEIAGSEGGEHGDKTG